MATELTPEEIDLLERSGKISRHYASMLRARAGGLEMLDRDSDPITGVPYVPYAPPPARNLMGIPASVEPPVSMPPPAPNMSREGDAPPVPSESALPLPAAGPPRPPLMSIVNQIDPRSPENRPLLKDALKDAGGSLLRRAVDPLGIHPVPGIAERVGRVAADKDVRDAAGNLFTMPNVDNAIDVGKAVAAANEKAGAPPKEKKQEGESDEVVDDVAPDTAPPPGFVQTANNLAATLAKYQAGLADAFDHTVGQGYEQLMHAYDEQGDALLRQANEQADAVEKANETVKQHRAAAMAEEKAWRERQIEKLNARLDYISAVSDQLANSKLDDTHWWSSKNFGQKLILAIGGIFASGAARKNLIGDIVNQDLAMQQEQYNRKKDNLSAQRTVFGHMMDLFKYESDAREKARLASEIAIKDYVKNQIDALALRHGGEDAKKRAAIEKHKINVELQKKRLELYEKLHPMPRMGSGSGVVGNVLGSDEQQRLFEVPSGQTFMALSKEDAEKFRTSFGAIASINASLDRAAEIKRQNPGKWAIPGTAANNELRAIQFDITATAKAAAGKGDNSDKDFAFRLASIGDITKPNPLGGSYLDQARAFGKGRERELVGHLQASGAVGVRTGYRRLPNGKTVRVFEYTGQHLRGAGQPQKPAPNAKKVEK